MALPPAVALAAALVAGLAALLAVPCTAKLTHTGIEINSNSYDDATHFVQSLAPSAVRTFMCISYGINTLTLNASLTLKAVRADPEPHLANFSASFDWRVFDQRVNISMYNSVRDRVVVISETWTNCLCDARFPGNATVVPFDPNYIGPSLFMAYTYLFARATARRYGSLVRYWQLDNELNMGYLGVVGGMRYGPAAAPVMAKPQPRHDHSSFQRCSFREPFNPMKFLHLPRMFPELKDTNYGYWANYTFMDDHVHTLFLAIKDELPSAYTLVNALADISDPIAKYLDLPYWADMLAKWRPYYDIVGLDMYPNRLSPLPFFKDTVATTIKTALNNQFLAAHHGVNHSFEQAPVWVLETGYPVWITTPTYYPASVNFTQQLQASYFQFFMETADAAGAEGVIVFGAWCGKGLSPPPGGYEAADLPFIAAANESFVTGQLDVLFSTMLSNITYVLDGRFVQLVESLTGNNIWVTFDGNNALLPSATELRSLFATYS